MKIKFNKSTLLNSLAFSKLAFPKKEIEPILNELHLTVISSDKIQVVTTDTDLMALNVVSAFVEDADVGDVITVPGKKFIDLLNRLSSDTVELVITDNDIQIFSGSYYGEFKSLGVEGYPDIRKIQEGLQPITINRSLLLTALQKVGCAVNDEEARKQLSAVELSDYGVVATNGAVCAVFMEPLVQEKMYISASCVSDLTSVLNIFKNFDNVEVYADESFLIFRFGESIFFSRLIAVKFPDVQRRVDLPSRKAVNRSLTFKTKEFEKALNRVSLSSPDDSKAIRISFKEDNAITLSAIDANGFKGAESVPAITENLEKGEDYLFNYSVLQDLIKQLAAETFKMELSTNIRIPARIQENKVLYLLMRLFDDTKVEQTDKQE